MGLLDKVDSQKILTPITIDLVNRHLQQGTGLLERIPLFFSFLIDFWHLKKGVFLSLKNSVYSPVETIGFDTTSARKIRAPSSLLDSWNLKKEGIVLEDNSLFEDLFSLRESSLIHQLLVIPLYYEAQIPFALILLVLEEEDNRIFTEKSFPINSDTNLMEKLNRSLNPFSDDNITKLIPTADDEIRKEIATEGEYRIIMEISLSSLLEKIGEIHNLRDPFELKNELLSLFSSFFNERVNLFLSESGRVIISYPEELFPGEKLLIRQIMNSLNQLYGSCITENFLSVKFRNLSENNKVTDSLTLE
jgi:hypothetical protein